MWNGKRISVIFPTYNEKDSIYQAIEDFFATGYVDEIVVVNNNAAPGTEEEVARTRAKQVFEKKQGYGAAIQRGLKEADPSSDFLIVSEPDGTFDGRDVVKLLAYADDFEYVIGTRTSREFIWAGANMGRFLKWGNWAVAKMVEFLFNTTLFTDVGCTMRLIRRDSLKKIEEQFTIDTSHFGLEMTLLAITNKLRLVEIPVNYKQRVGQSSVTGSKVKSFTLGMTMINMILVHRLKTL
ncbi:MAG TPA: glycosyltransferase family 2 protein [candidate division Zixibacteria bacterium]|jgi:glycosyltransferase involved in cell wall biosynthesis|nr:glycosyltransferase family 2 protein [Candidatus Latescibacterota bacterium]HIG47722.1 glycosyltransferase family 2 protein [candidate division Zixibacteria bacterium]